MTDPAIQDPHEDGYTVEDRREMALREALERDQANTDIDLRDLLRHTFAALAPAIQDPHEDGYTVEDRRETKEADHE